MAAILDFTKIEFFFFFAGQLNLALIIRCTLSDFRALQVLESAQFFLPLALVWPRLKLNKASKLCAASHCASYDPVYVYTVLLFQVFGGLKEDDD